MIFGFAFVSKRRRIRRVSAGQSLFVFVNDVKLLLFCPSLRIRSASFECTPFHWADRSSLAHLEENTSSHLRLSPMGEPSPSPQPEQGKEKNVVSVGWIEGNESLSHFPVDGRGDRISGGQLQRIEQTKYFTEDETNDGNENEDVRRCSNSKFLPDVAG